jgi:menaquinol-cytochrome c reductase iron-sulfur subunit
MPDDPDRRKFLKVATCAIGGGLGLAAGIPAVKLLLDPTGKQIVTTPKEPLDLGPADRLRVGGPPRRFDVIAPVVQDAWTSATNVVLGAAWLRRTAPDKIEAFSGTCPHLGCAIGWEGDGFLCPCHDSRFTASGEKQTGPSERGLDPLPIEIKGDRLQLTWIRYKLGQSNREPV